MERGRRHDREQVRIGEIKNGGGHGHKLSGGTGVLAERKVCLCRRERRRSAGGGEGSERRDDATVFYRSLYLWHPPNLRPANVHLGLAGEPRVPDPPVGSAMTSSSQHY